MTFCNRLGASPRLTFIFLLLSSFSLAEEISNTSARLKLSGPSTAGSVVDASLVVRVEEALAPGTVITVQQHWLDESRLQHDDPQGEAFLNTRDLPDSEKIYEEVSGVEGGVDAIFAAPGYRVGALGLAAGSNITFEVTNLVLPTVADHQFSLAVFLRPPSKRPRRIATNAVTLEAAEFDRITVTAKSLSRPGKDVDLRVRMEDRFGNLVDDRPLSLDLRVNGAFRQRAELDRSVSLVPGVSFDGPGIYQVELRSGGGGIKAFSNRIRVGDYESDLVWVDFAGMKRESGGRLDPERMLLAGGGYFDLVLPWNERDMTGVVQPEKLVDLRQRTIATTKLVQIASGASQYIWLGNRVAGQGYAVGFVGSNDSRQYPRDHQTVHTAVISGSGGWNKAMNAGNTYVSIGERMIVLPESRELEMAEVRNIGFEITAGGPIDSITLYKNGEALDVAQGARLDESIYQLSVASDSTPFSRVLSLPRNAREWVGYVAIRDARILLPENLVARGWRLNAQPSKRRVDFLTKTHGTVNRLLLLLEETTPDTVLEIGIAEGFEDAAWLPEDRLPQPTPGQRFLVPLAEAESVAVRTMEVSGYSDRLVIERARAPLSEDGSYNYRYQDQSAPRKGDYYYLVIRQQNGAVAFSSTVFIGL